MSRSQRSHRESRLTVDKEHNKHAEFDQACSFDPESDGKLAPRRVSVQAAGVDTSPNLEVPAKIR